MACAKVSWLPKYPEGLDQFHLIQIKDNPMSNKLRGMVVNVRDLEIDTYQFRDKIIRCLAFDVVQVNPYQVKYLGEVALDACHEISGFKPHETAILWNWIDDVFREAEKQQCFVKKP